MKVHILLFVLLRFAAVICPPCKLRDKELQLGLCTAHKAIRAASDRWSPSAYFLLQMSMIIILLLLLLVLCIDGWLHSHDDDLSTLLIWLLQMSSMSWYELILDIALPDTPFFWKGPTRAEKLKFATMTEMSWIEISFNATEMSWIEAFNPHLSK